MRATYSIDERSLLALERMAAALSKSKSEVVREAIIEYDARRDRLSEEERQAKLAILSELRSRPADRTEADLQDEIDDIGAQRRADRRDR